MSNVVRVCHQFSRHGRCNYGERCRFVHTRTENIDQEDAIEAGNNVLAEFFAQYPDFNYVPTASSSLEFYRMCHIFGWEREDEERIEAHKDFRTALVRQFNATYGTDVNSIETWLGLCVALDIQPLPETPKQARETLKHKFVNLIDLVDKHNNGQPITQFANLQDLQEYTISTGKYFPKDSAYAGGVLRFLLREILCQHGQYRKEHKDAAGRTIYTRWSRCT